MKGVYALWLSCSVFLSGSQTVLPPPQPPHACHQVSTCPPPSSPLSICEYSLLSRWMIAYSWVVHIRPMTYTLSLMAEKHQSCQEWQPSKPLSSPTWTSSQAWAAVGSCVQHSSQVESDRLSRAGGLYEVALKGLRRATNYEHLSFNPYSVMDKQNLCMWSHPQSTLNTYTLSHFHVSICSTHTQKFKLYSIHTHT